MMKSAIDDILKKDLPQVMQRHPAILSAYVFGSVAMGFEHRRSDVDIAVRVDAHLKPDAIFNLRLQLTDELEDILGCPVDVIVLDTASLKMIHQVMKTGRMVYVTDPKRETAFQLQKQKEYFDFRYFIEDDRKALKTFYGC